MQRYKNGEMVVFLGIKEATSFWNTQNKIFHKWLPHRKSIPVSYVDDVGIIIDSEFIDDNSINYFDFIYLWLHQKSLTLYMLTSREIEVFDKLSYRYNSDFSYI